TLVRDPRSPRQPGRYHHAAHPRPARSGVPRRPHSRDERAARPSHCRASRPLRPPARSLSHVRACLQRDGAGTATPDRRTPGDRMTDVTVRSQPRPTVRIPWIRLAPWLYTLALFALWEIAVAATGVSHPILPAPSRVFAAIVQYWPAIQRNSIQTLLTTLA